MQQYALISHNCIHVKYQIAKKLGHMGKNLKTVLKSVPHNYSKNALKPQSPRNSFNIFEICYYADVKTFLQTFDFCVFS